tara:strand:- start:245 stop:1012 length:768 start_codon:yes stop_codon:yes gene_type:complete
MAITIGTGSISFDGTIFRTTDLIDLKAGKSIATDADKKFVNSATDTTYIRMGSSNKAWHYIDGQPLLKLGIGNVNIGDTSTNVTIGSAGIGGATQFGGGTATLNITGSGGVTIEGPTTLGAQGITGGMMVTGSTIVTGSFESTGSFEISGSTTVTGGFGVGNLLDVLSNWGAVGLPTGSAATGSGGGISVGDINLDGQVNVTDLLLLLLGMGNPQCIDTDLVIPQNTNYQMIGPEIGICEGITVTVGTNSFFSIT